MIWKVTGEWTIYTYLTLAGQVDRVRQPEMQPETAREDPLLYETLWSNSTVCILTGAYKHVDEHRYTNIITTYPLKINYTVK